jgi:hypothetical protein
MTNDSVRGYIVIVLKNLGYKIEEIEKVLDELHYVFDVTSESDAEQYFYSRKWQENK